MILFEESAQFWIWKVINKQFRHIWTFLMQNFEQKCNSSLDQSNTLHIHCCHLVAKNLNCSWAGIIHDGLSLAFQRWWYKKNAKERFFFSLYYLLPDLLCYILLNPFHISTNLKEFPFKWYQEYTYPCFNDWATGR